MATGLAQTLGFWVDQATIDKWGEDCVAAMLACHLNPDNFGSYNEVDERCRAARDRVAAWRAAERIEDPQERAQAMQALGGPPTPNEFHLAECQSGHLMQHSAAHDPSGRVGAAREVRSRDLRTTDRHDRCANIVDGYDQSAVPCMPMTRRTSAERRRGTSPRARTEPHPPEVHDRVGAMEQQQARDRAADAGLTNSPPGRPGEQSPRGLDYTQDQRRADQRERNREMVDAHLDSRHREQSLTRATEARSAYEDTTREAMGADGSGGAGGTDGESPTAPSAPDPSEDQKQKAADCISEQAEAAEDKMYQDCADSAEENAATAASEAHQEEVRRLAGEYQTARDAMTGTPPGYVMEDLTYLQARQRREAARREYYDAASLGCYADQGSRIAAGQGNTSGRIPGGSFDPSIPPTHPGSSPSHCIPPGNVPPPASSPPTSSGPTSGTSL